MTKRRTNKAPAKKRAKSKPKATAKAKSPELPAKVSGRPDLPPPHVGRPVRNHHCIQCEMHRKLNRQAARDRALAAVADLAFGPLTVTAAKNATEALKDALGIK